MVRTFACRDGQLIPADGDSGDAIWLDLLNPTADEDRRVEQRLGISIPTKGEMEEIELSARLYHEDGAEFMTVTAVLNLATDEPVKTPMTFILKGSTLATVRYAEPMAFSAFAARAQRQDATCLMEKDAMLGLIETMINRITDAPSKGGGRKSRPRQRAKLLRRDAVKRA